MKIRRYYDNKKRYKRYLFPEHYDVETYIATMGGLGYSEEQAFAFDTAEYELLLDDDEQETWFNDCLNRVLENPRWYLDNLEYLPTFRVRIKKIYPLVKGSRSERKKSI